MAVLSLRRQALGVRGRVRDPHRDGSPTLSGSQGREGLRASAQEQGQESYAYRLDEPFWDGGVDVPRGGHRRESLRGPALEAMEEALFKVTAADAAGWFEHCGYPVEVQYL